MTWIDQARQVAKDYRANQKELERLKDGLTYGLSANSSGLQSVKISKPVEIAVEQIFSQERIAYLEKAIQAVDFALEIVSQKPNGTDILQLFDMLYYHKSHTIRGISYKLHISERTTKNYNKYFLKVVAIKMGFYKES